MKSKIPANFALAHHGEPTQADGTPLPITVQKATIVADYAQGGVIRATLEGLVMTGNNQHELDVEADMIVRGRDGRKYRLTEVSE